MIEHRILLALSTTRWSRTALEFALQDAIAADAAGMTVQLDVLYVIEQDEIDKVIRAVGESGFLGTRPQAEITSTLLQEHMRTAQDRILQVRKAVEARGFETREIEVTGNYDAEVRKRALEGHYDVVLLVRSDRPFITRLLLGSDADRVARWVRAEGLGKVIVEDTES